MASGHAEYRSKRLNTGHLFGVPPGRFTQPKVRAFTDFLAHSFSGRGPSEWLRNMLLPLATKLPRANWFGAFLVA